MLLLLLSEGDRHATQHNTGPVCVRCVHSKASKHHHRSERNLISLGDSSVKSTEYTECDLFPADVKLEDVLS